jgi:mannitol-specific phosphotransferase system IIBC component
MTKFVSILVSLLFTFSVTAIAFAVDKEVETPQKIEKGSQTMGEKKAQSPAMMKKEVKGKETKKAHKAKKVKRIKKVKKTKKPLKKASKKPSSEGTQ